MKILLVEDGARKRAQINDHVAVVLPNASVTEATSFHSAMDVLREMSVDLVLLDMSVPVYETLDDGKRSEMWVYGGEEILRQIRRRELDVRVIVVTQYDFFADGKIEKSFDDIEAEMSAKFRPQYVGAVFYRAGDAMWQTQLTALIRKVMDERGMT